ncbi:hypothetical protein B0H14DRAFT_2645704 [Mycena olivaceomarginata]|nr:hypothetical protein B0H14DRAFT_2645704 [Mycena olivaceomarginata]
MIADMISMMSDHGIRVEIVPLQPPSIFGIIRSLANILIQLIWNNYVQKICSWTSRPDPRAVGGAHLSSKGSTEGLNVPRILGNNFPIARGDSTQSKLALRTKGALVGERNQLSHRIEKMEPRELRQAVTALVYRLGQSGPSQRPKLEALSATQWTTGLSGSLDHLHQKQAEVPVIFTRENCGLKAKQMVNRASPFPSCKLRISTEPSGPGRIGKDVLDGNNPLMLGVQTIWTSRELVGIWLNIGIGIRACHPQNCQSACPVTEWNEMQLPGVNCWHQQNLQDPQGRKSKQSAIRSQKVLEIRSKAITGLPALLDFHTD